MNESRKERFATLQVRARSVVEIGKDVEELWDAGSPCPNVDDKFAFVHEAVVGDGCRTKTESPVPFLRSGFWNVATLEINYIIPFSKHC